MNADSNSKTPVPTSAKSSSTLLYSTLGVLIVASILIAINYLVHLSNAKADFTDKKIHTLSEGTIEVLKELKLSDAPVTVKLFVSPDEDIPNPNWLVMFRELTSRLDVFKGHAGGKLKIEVRRPRSDTDDEDAAQQNGVNPQALPNGENIYFGLAATCLDKTAMIPFIPAIDSQMMEFKMIRAISRVVPSARKTIGLMTPLEMDGAGAMAMMGMGGAPPSYFYRELSQDYDVVKVDVNSNEIKTNEYTEYTLDFAKGEFSRQEYKDGTAGVKGNGAFSIEGATDPKNGGKALAKLDSTRIRVNEGGRMSDLDFTTASTGNQLSNAKNEGFAYTYTVEGDSKAIVKVSKGIDVLVVVHPATISEEAQWAIDQYILKGGKVVALLDSYSIAAAESGRQPNPMTGQRGAGTPPSSSLDKLLTAWGYTFDSTKAVADINYAAPMFGNNPLIITPPRDAINKSNTITQGLSDFVFAFTGGFTGKAGFGLQEEILIESSRQNQLVGTDNLNQNTIKNIPSKFVSSDQRRILAVRVSGKFPTAFPQGKPDAPPPPPPSGPGGMGGMGGFPMGFPGGPQGDPGAPGAAAPAPAAAPETTAPAPATPPASPPVVNATPAAPVPAEATPATPASTAAPAPVTPAVPAAPATPAPPAEPAKPKVPSLNVAEKEGTVFLIADSDLIYDPVSLEQNRGQLGEPVNANLPFVLNVIDDLAGNGGLIQARSRTSSARPFTKLNEILEETNKDLRAAQQKVETEIEQWKSELQSTNKKNPNSPFIMINQRQLDELNEKIEAGEAKKRALRKEFRKNIDSKFNSYQSWNILGVPILIALIGIAVVLTHKFKTAAR